MNFKACENCNSYCLLLEIYAIIENEVRIMKVTMKFTQVKMEDYIKNFCFRDKFLAYCKDCINYNNNYSCPGFDFDPDEYLNKYNYLYLIGTKVVLNQEEVAEFGEDDIVDKFVYGRNIVKSVRKTLDAKLLKMEGLFPLTRAFFAGSCTDCAECERMHGNPCPDIGRVRYSLEAFGFDMSLTAKELLDLDIIWADDYLPEYYTLVSGLATVDEIPGFNKLFINL